MTIVIATGGGPASGAFDRLKLYNAALRIAGDRRLASLTETREPRRVLDDVWNDAGVRACLEQGQWNFAIRAQRFEYDPSVTVDWGLRYAFTKPDDWVLTAALCSDEYFNSPLLQYRDEGRNWWADIDTIYVQYVSDDLDAGGDLTQWPQSFADYAAAEFCYRCVMRLTRDKEAWAAAAKVRGEYLKIAKNKDAMNNPTQMMPRGTWSRARTGFSRNYERGLKTGNLTE